MTRRELGWPAMAAALNVAAGGAARRRPNVVVCFCDQLRAFALGCYGNHFVRTPNIDRLAARGFRFEHAVTNGPVCVPGRSCLMSGQYTRTCTGESVELWFWNGLPNDVRTITAHLATWGADKLTIAGKGPAAGRLAFGDLLGETVIEPKTWHHVALVRDGADVRVYLKGKLDSRGTVPAASPGGDLFLGSQGDGSETLEGAIDEVAVYRRGLKPGEIAGRWKLVAPAGARVSR